MNIKSVLLLFILLSISSYLYLFEGKDTSAAGTTQVIDNADTLQKPASTQLDKERPSADKHQIIKDKGSQITETKDESTRLNESKTADIKTDNNFFKADVFGSIDNLNETYVNHDGSISRKSIETTFTKNNFDLTLSKINQMSKDHQSYEREQLLRDFLYANFEASFSEENISCAGMICATSFKTSLDDSSKLNKLKNFAVNYSFSSLKQNKYGENIYKALYIKTDSPSSLTLD